MTCGSASTSEVSPSHRSVPKLSTERRSHIPDTELHIVLDKEDRHIEFVAHKANRLHKLRSLVRVHSRGGLIEKKKLRRGCKRARYLKLALLSVRKVAGEVIALVLKVEHREKLHRALVHLTLIGKMTGRRNTASAADADIEL